MSGFGGGGGATIDDATITLGTSSSIPVAYLADEVSTDSVDEGDVGVARMTLDRKQIGASEYPGATAITAGTSYLTLVGAVFDDVGIVAPTESAIGYFRMGSDRVLYSRVMGGNVASLGVDSGNPVKIGAVYNSTAPTVATGQRVDMQADSLGNLQVNSYTKLAGEDLTNDVMKVEQQNSYSNITLAAPTATVVKSGAGMLHAIVVNKAAATGVITIYDNTAASGTIIGTITMPAALLANQFTLLFDVKFATGLTVNTATAAQDLTVAYR